MLLYVLYVCMSVEKIMLRKLEQVEQMEQMDRGGCIYYPLLCFYALFFERSLVCIYVLPPCSGFMTDALFSMLSFLCSVL